MSAIQSAEIDRLDVDLEKLMFETDKGVGSRAALGLLVLCDGAGRHEGAARASAGEACKRRERRS